jgi:hypothetical protein
MVKKWSLVGFFFGWFFILMLSVGKWSKLSSLNDFLLEEGFFSGLFDEVI